ncbi:hypothetical protein PV761_09210 [Arthrobacter sp. CC3]|uniref:hypothetical protein n=1 Tax=Arthrobacter sp. CC3 TaxID=3029185 RepID=UPI003266910A
MEAMSGLAMSMVGKLLEEVSWEHATSYRQGGRGRENVLSAEVMMALDFLPRDRFLGAAIRAATGAESARTLLINEIEEAELRFLPGDLTLAPNRPGNDQLVVQPDALITSPSSFVLVEAKRVRASSFQPEQLAREYVATMAHAGTRTPLILLLGAAPPVLVRGRGRMSLEDAISAELESVLLRANNEELALEGLVERIHDVFCWITWTELSAVIGNQAADFSTTDPSVNASVQRLAESLRSSIAWHT